MRRRRQLRLLGRPTRPPELLTASLPGPLASAFRRLASGLRRLPFLDQARGLGAGRSSASAAAGDRHPARRHGDRVRSLSCHPQCQRRGRLGRHAVQPVGGRCGGVRRLVRAGAAAKRLSGRRSSRWKPEWDQKSGMARQNPARAARARAWMFSTGALKGISQPVPRTKAVGAGSPGGSAPAGVCAGRGPGAFDAGAGLAAGLVRGGLEDDAGVAGVDRARPPASPRGFTPRRRGAIFGADLGHEA